jgi:hypothetical protein
MQRRNFAIGFAQSRRVLVAIALVAVTSGCVANHSFVHGDAINVSNLVSELDAIKADDDHDALYDMTYIPFVYLDLQVFAQTEDTRRYPHGHTFGSVRSWLPLFGIVDGEIELFDAERSAYEKNEFRSVLWGLWSRRLTTIQTAIGERIERNYNLLWIFNSGPNIRYRDL